jgi:hypothetical protein
MKLAVRRTRTRENHSRKRPQKRAPVHLRQLQPDAAEGEKPASRTADRPASKAFQRTGGEHSR